MDKTICVNGRSTGRLYVTLFILAILTNTVVEIHATATYEEYDTDFGCSSEEKNSKSAYCTNGKSTTSEYIHRNNKYTEDHCEDDDYECLRKKLAENAELSCKRETLDLLEKAREGLIDAAAFRGDSLSNVLLSIRDVHLQTRKNYAQLIEGVGKNLYPLIIATDSDTPELSGVGGVYKLYLRDGNMKRIAPVAKEYELHKCLSHMALGLFATVSPYFRSPNSRNWRPAVIEYQNRVLDALTALDNLQSKELSLDDQIHARKMLKMVNVYLKNCLTSNSVEVDEYTEFSKKFAPYINTSMRNASKLQVDATLPALRKWKEELGDDWEKTFVIIPTVWPVSQLNTRLQMLEKLMTFRHFREKVLVVESAKNEDDARTTLGRVTADRALAQLVFADSPGKDNEDHVFSLSTRRDLMSTAAARAIKEFCKDKPVELCGCPMAVPLDNLIF